jgi:vesicular inhibitory amino acid transporter
VLCGHKNGPLRTAWNYFVALLGLVCTYFGTTASMKSLAAKAAGVA